jgi:hypothetical protein
MPNVKVSSLLLLYLLLYLPFQLTEHPLNGVQLRCVRHVEQRVEIEAAHLLHNHLRGVPGYVVKKDGCPWYSRCYHLKISFKIKPVTFSLVYI